MPKSTDSKSKKPPVCVFCKSSEDDEIHFGKFFHSKDLSVHNFCLLFSSGLSQNGKNDNDGFAGFLPKDIRKEVARGKRLRCSYCKTTGATVGCCKPQCKKVFHINCGLRNNSLHLFYGSFPSYCSFHKSKPIYPEGELPSKDPYCAICYNPVYLKNYDTTVWTSCCKNGWFHKSCIQRQANSAGYFFRCPLCNNTEQFQKQMLRHGIYIPQQDASWELEENAFQELLFRHEQCDADNCLCPKGRKYSRKAPPWRLVLCQDCGSQGRHVGCDDSVTSKFSWKCLACVEITKKLKLKKESECLAKKKKKTNHIQKSQPQKVDINKRTLRSSAHSSSSSTENTPLVKEEISSALEELRQSVEASSHSLHEGGPSFHAGTEYKIIKISKSEPLEKIENSICQENEMCLVSDGALHLSHEESSSSLGGTWQPSNFQDLLATTTDSSPPETKVAVDNLDSKDCAKIPTLEQEHSIDLFSEVDASLLEGNFDSFSCKSEIYSQDYQNEFKKESSSNFLNHSSLNEYKGACDLSVAERPASQILHNDNSVDSYTGITELESIKNYLRQHERKFCDDSSVIEAKDCKKSCSASENKRAVSLTNGLVHCETLLLPKIPPVDVSQSPKYSIEKELRETSTAKDDLSQLSVSPCDTLKSSNKTRRHSKRICTEVEDKLSKKRKLNAASVKPCNTVIILSITRDIKQNVGTEHKYEMNPSSKTVSEISQTSGSNSKTQNGQRVDERYSKEALDTENVLGNKSPIIMNICSSLGHNSEKDREPLVKLGIPNRLAQNTLKAGCASDGSEVSHNSGHGSKNHLESENRTFKKQKLNSALSKKRHSTSLKYKDSYLCIKALFGKPCDCCKEKSRLSKQSNGKSNHHKKCTQSCKHKYDIDCYRSGSVGNKSDEKSSGNKHSCNRPPSYVVDVLKSGPAMATIDETKKKLSVKPQVIHLKHMSH